MRVNLQRVDEPEVQYTHAHAAEDCVKRECVRIGRREREKKLQLSETKMIKGKEDRSKQDMVASSSRSNGDDQAGLLADDLQPYLRDMSHAAYRRPVHVNLDARTWVCPAAPDNSDETDEASLVSAFHRQLPGYEPTPLFSLDTLAAELGLAKIYVKNESSRLSLPSFKILGASWGVVRALLHHLHLPLNCTLDQLKSQLEKLIPTQPITVVAATDGNHGRAVAYMCSQLPNVTAVILVPSELDPGTIERIASHGPQVIKVKGSYDAAVAAAFELFKMNDYLLVQDTSFSGYTDVPQVYIYTSFYRLCS